MKYTESSITPTVFLHLGIYRLMGLHINMLYIINLYHSLDLLIDKVYRQESLKAVEKEIQGISNEIL